MQSEKRMTPNVHLQHAVQMQLIEQTIVTRKSTRRSEKTIRRQRGGCA
ncbi:hypothetical protein PO124_30120 [Bacillus licheniformis]|nr:hypothetical protein [Bacillus licheniformis]